MIIKINTMGEEYKTWQMIFKVQSVNRKRVKFAH